MSTKLILASASPRRQQLLRCQGIPFTVFQSHSEAQCAPDAPTYALACTKALAVGAQQSATHFVLGADTQVFLPTPQGQVVLGKPHSAAQAEQMLRSLSSVGTHYVRTAIALTVPEKALCAPCAALLCNTNQGAVADLSTAAGQDTHGYYDAARRCYVLWRTVCTDVTFRTLGQEEIASYVQSDEPYDKAGGYGIQGKAACFVSSICGDYSNVVGLPVCSLYTLFAFATGHSLSDLGKEGVR